jgi:hypothetical protein
VHLDTALSAAVEDWTTGFVTAQRCVDALQRSVPTSSCAVLDRAGGRNNLQQLYGMLDSTGPDDLDNSSLALLMQELTRIQEAR